MLFEKNGLSHFIIAIHRKFFYRKVMFIGRSKENEIGKMNIAPTSEGLKIAKVSIKPQ